MANTLEILPTHGPIEGSVRPPGSKSLTNRALVCAALAHGTSELLGVLDSEDTGVMIDALDALGIEVRVDHAQQTAKVDGCGGAIPASAADLYIANSGTSVRFLAAVGALGHGRYRLHGTPRMHERPIQDLLDALNQLGVQATSEAGTGCPPILIEADGLPQDRTKVRGDVSSQFLSALLMAAPYAGAMTPADEVAIDIDGPLVSRPYVAMTLAVMRDFGAGIEHDDAWRRFRVSKHGYRATQYAIEPDASAASYFWAAAAVTGGRVKVLGLTRDSFQGDVAFCECLEQMGCLVEYDVDGITVEGRPLAGIEVDMNAISDTVQTLAAVALFAEGPTTVRGVAHIRHKETDRISAVATELRRLGAHVEERPDGLAIAPRPLHAAEIETYNDHRMAMSLSLVGLRTPGVVIRDPQCTSKTYPGFWSDLDRLRGAR